MAIITLQGNKIQTVGELPLIGENIPDFNLTAVNFSRKKLADFSGKRLILNIFPSIDTETCAASVRNFNKEAASLTNTTVLCISKDLPFAQARFCGAEGLKNVVMLSDFATGNFGKDYGLKIENGPFAALLSRSIIVVDENGAVIYTEQVSEIANEPNYEKALNTLK